MLGWIGNAIKPVTAGGGDALLFIDHRGCDIAEGPNPRRIGRYDGRPEAPSPLGGFRVLRTAVITLTLYVRQECHLCAAAEQLLGPLAAGMGVTLELLDIDDPGTDSLLRAHYDTAVPVLHLNGYEIARHRIEPATVRSRVAFARTTVVVLSKFPTPGKVKTRLTVGDRAITPMQAAAVHRASLLHLLARLGKLRPCRLVLCFDPPESSTDFAELLRANGRSAELIPQASGDLGERISAAHQTVSKGGSLPLLRNSVLYLGVDSPDVPDGHLLAAGAILAESGATLGPTPDGGYWCIGLGAELPVRELLHGIPWSSGREYTATLERLTGNGYPCPPSPAWDDVDHPVDLFRLMDRLARSDRQDDRGLHGALTVALGGNPS